MSEQHNPTPWTIGNNRCNKGGRSIIAPKNVIVGVCRGDYSRRNDSSLAVDEANARRIVACVNACEGIDNEGLELILNSGVTIGAIIKRAGELKQEQDDLLKAIKEVMGNVGKKILNEEGDEGTFDIEIWPHDMDAFVNLREAIAKAEAKSC